MKRLITPFFALLILAGVGKASTSNLPRSYPEAEGISSAAVLAMIEGFEERIDSVHSFMLLRNGKVVSEGWWAPYEPESQHTLYSLTKSFNATAVGIAQDEGLLSVEDTVISFFPDLTPELPSNNMKQMRIRDLLTMTTGHVNDTMGTLRAAEDGAWVRAFLATDPEHRPGIHFRYNSGASYMLSAIVQKVSGNTVLEYLGPRLFEPLGIETPFWGQSAEGVNLGGGGMKAKTEDMAKLGLLYLQKGVWNGKRIVSEAWVEAATDRQTSSGSGHGGNWNHGYGYQFWRNKPMGYRGDGAFGQFSFVLPEHNVVLAVTSGTSDMGGVMDVVWETLLPGISEDHLPSDEFARDRLFDKLGSLSLAPQDGEKSSPTASAVTGRKYVFKENDQGVKSVAVDFSEGRSVVTLEDGSGMHRFEAGADKWMTSASDFRPRISNLYEDHGQQVAVSSAWTGENAFALKICFAETPYIAYLTLSFEGDSLHFDMSHNLRWDGPLERPRLTAILE